MEPEPDSDEVFEPVQILSSDEDDGAVPETAADPMTSIASTLLAGALYDDNAMDVADDDDVAEDVPDEEMLAAVDEGATRPAAGDAMEDDEELRCDRLMRMMANLARDCVPLICVNVTQQRTLVHVPRGYASPVFAHLVQRLYAGSQPRADDAQWAAYLLRYVREYGMHKVPVARPAADDLFRSYPERLKELKVSADLVVKDSSGVCVALLEDWTENPGLGRVRMWCSAARERPMWAVLERLFRVLEPRPPFWSEARMKAELMDDPALLSAWNDIFVNFRSLSNQRPG